MVCWCTINDGYCTCTCTTRRRWLALSVRSWCTHWWVKRFMQLTSLFYTIDVILCGCINMHGRVRIRYNVWKYSATNWMPSSHVSALAGISRLLLMMDSADVEASITTWKSRPALRLLTRGHVCPSRSHTRARQKSQCQRKRRPNQGTSNIIDVSD